jgi:hypothetical protein
LVNTSDEKITTKVTIDNQGLKGIVEPICLSDVFKGKSVSIANLHEFTITLEPHDILALALKDQ